MKKEAVLLNLGRGPIVNETDLAEALTNGTIAGAGLDVLCAEPMREDNPLRTIKDSTKLIITPHIAWGTVEARKRCVDEVFLNIKAFQNGGKRNLVTG
jgi:glycerate dehydrogenase